LTTTETRIDPELDTRMLTVVTDDSADQTRAVLLAIAGEEDRAGEIDYRSWHDLQEWLASTPEEVHVPYVEAMARPFLAVLRESGVTSAPSSACVRAHALLHKLNRERESMDASSLHSTTTRWSVRSPVTSSRRHSGQAWRSGSGRRWRPSPA